MFYLNNNKKKLKEEYENRFAEWKSKYLLEKNEYKSKCDLLQSKLNKTNKKMAEVAKMHEKVSILFKIL